MRDSLPGGITIAALALAIAAAALIERRPASASPMAPPSSAAAPADEPPTGPPEPPAEPPKPPPVVEALDPAPADLVTSTRIAAVPEIFALAGVAQTDQTGRRWQHLSARRKGQVVMLERGPCDDRKVAVGEQVLERGRDDEAVYWTSLDPRTMSLETGRARLGSEGELLEVVALSAPVIETRDERVGHRCVAARDRCGMTTYCRVDRGKLAPFTTPVAGPLLGAAPQTHAWAEVEGAKVVRIDAPLDGEGAAAAGLAYIDSSGKQVLLLSQITRAAGEPASTLLLWSSSRRPALGFSRLFVKHPLPHHHHHPSMQMMDLF